MFIRRGVFGLRCQTEPLFPGLPGNTGQSRPASLPLALLTVTHGQPSMFPKVVLICESAYAGFGVES